MRRSHRSNLFVSWLLVLIMLLSQLLAPFAPVLAQENGYPAPDATQSTSADLPSSASLLESLPSPISDTLPVYDPVPPTPAQPLSLLLQASATQAQPDETLTYTVTLSNLTEEPLANLVVSDTLPAGLQYIQGSTQHFTFDANTSWLGWYITDLAPGAMVTGTFQAMITHEVALGNTLVNTAEVHGSVLVEPAVAHALVMVGAPQDFAQSTIMQEDLPEVLPEIDAQLPLGVELTASEGDAHLGETLMYTVTVGNHGVEPIADVVISNTVPQELAYIPANSDAFDYDAASQQLTWNVPLLQPGEMVTGTFHAQVTSSESAIVNQIEVTAPELETPADLWSAIPTGLSTENQVLVTPDGGVIHAESEPFGITFPVEAVTQTVEVQVESIPVTEAPSDAAPESGSTETALSLAGPSIVEAFELTATTLEGTPITTFTHPLTFTLNVHEHADALRAQGGTPTLYWLNETTEQWELVPGTFNPDTRTLVTIVDHFSTFGLGTHAGMSYGLPYLPTTKGFTSDEFTGNSSVAYPLTLPPAPGNMKFGLSLAYSSESVNSLFATATDAPNSPVGYNVLEFMRQANPIGWGWDLQGLGQVSHGNGKFYLSFGGGSFELVRDPATQQWQTKPQSFVRIESPHAGGNNAAARLWHVWTQDGYRYTFGSDNWEDGSVAYNKDGDCNYSIREARLREIEDPWGNRVSVSYGREYGSGPGCNYYVRAVRPTRIEYFAVHEPLATVRIHFGYYDDRRDKAVWNWTSTWTASYFTDWRLQNIYVQARHNTGTYDYATMRRYELEQDYDWWNADPTWHDQAPPTGTDGRAIMRLRSVTEVGSSGGALPAWQFVYARAPGGRPPTNLLKIADNGQGGSIEYWYDHDFNIPVLQCSTTNTYHTERFRVTRTDVDDGLRNIVRTYYTTDSSKAYAQGTNPNNGCSDNFEFGGYREVRRDVRDQNETLYQSFLTYYLQANSALTELVAAKGRVYDQRILDPSGTQLQRVYTHWDWPNTNGTPWIHAAWENSYRHGSLTRQTQYAYDTALQDGVQYGRLTQRREYRYISGLGLEQQPYRTNQTRYRHDVVDGDYLIAPSELMLTDSGGGCQSRTLIHYHGDPSPFVPSLQQKAQNDCTSGPWSNTSYKYDLWGNLEQVTNPRGYVSETVHDNHERVTMLGYQEWPRFYALPLWVTEAWGTSVAQQTRLGSYGDTINWGAVGQLHWVTDPNGQTTYVKYDQFGRLSSYWKPGEDVYHPTEAFSYINYVPGTPSYAPGTPFRVERRQREDSATYGYIYSHTYYDGMGREVQALTPYVDEANVRQWSVSFTRYNPLGQPSEVYAPWGETPVSPVPFFQPGSRPRTTFTYDGLGRPVTETHPDHSASHYARKWWSYGAGWSEAHDENGDTTRHYFDQFERLIQVRDYTGQCLYMVGTCGKNPYSFTDYTYDIADQLTKLAPMDRDGITPLANPTQIGYDLQGNKVWMEDPDMGHWQYRYDAVGNLLKQRDGRGMTTCLAYDALNRPVGKFYQQISGTVDVYGCPAYSSSWPVRYSYDAYSNTPDTATEQYGRGHRTRMDDATGSTTWQYDERGRVWKETKVINGDGGGTFVTQWTYDPLDRVRTMQYPAAAGIAAETVTYNYRALTMNLTGLTNGTTSYASRMGYDASGHLLQLQYGTSPAVVQRFDYWNVTSPNGRGRLGAIRAGTNSTSDNLLNIGYHSRTNVIGYDAVGNVTHILNRGTGEEQAFTYDDLDRLVTAQAVRADGSTPEGGYLQERYAYDKLGNTPQRATQSYQFGNTAPQNSACPANTFSDPLRQLPHALLQNSTNGNYYCYNNVGNMVQRKEGWDAATGQYQNTTNYVYDNENRLVQVKRNSTTLVNYRYDGDGRRVQEWTQSTSIGGVITTHYVNYIGTLTEVAVQRQQYGTGTPIFNYSLMKYYYAGARRVAMRSNNNAPQYLLGDHLGSMSMSLNSDATIASEVRYKPFGYRRWSSGTIPTHYQFTGQSFDQDTGLYFYNARFYDPTLGRFIQADTIVPEPGNPQALNRYSYVYNNPVRYTDPSGHCPSLLACTAGAGLETGYRLGGGDSARRDQIGGALVIKYSDVIQRQANSHGIDPILIAAVLRHESGAFERAIFSPYPGGLPGITANSAEAMQVLLMGDRASIGPAQMQLRRARELEQLGYVRSRGSDLDRVAALLDPATAIEYIAGELHFLSDQLHTIRGFANLSRDEQRRLILIGYNQGWENLKSNIEALGFRGVIERSAYDNQTLDEYARWATQNAYRRWVAIHGF